MIHYLYRHIRHDKNEPFYIGIGTIHKLSAEKETFRYRRAYSHSHRNKLWVGVVKKSGFDVEILFESNDRNEIVEKEVEFIKLYGRKDLGNGTLCNLTDGGEGTLNISSDVKKVISKKNRENGCFERNGKWLAERNRTVGNSWKGRSRPEGYPGFKPKYVYDINGVFIKKFDSTKLAADYCGIKSKSITSAVKQNASRNGYYFFNNYIGESFEIKIKQRGKSVYKIDPISGTVVSVFDSCRKASIEAMVKDNTLCTKISNKIICNGFIWSYESVVDVSGYSTAKKNQLSGGLNCESCGAEKKIGEFCRKICRKCFLASKNGVK